MNLQSPAQARYGLRLERTLGQRPVIERLALTAVRRCALNVVRRSAAFLSAALLLLFPLAQINAVEWPWSRPAPPRQQPHPAVVRVNVEESDGMAHGSGALVDARDRYGVVVTNWHVVRDATGSISVVFPDGFRSAARVIRVDRDWDLAALLIWRPRAAPLPLATQAPRPGDQLTIAGYGAGDYRTAAGRCTQYVAPSNRHPFEMVEVAASARQGDSGGPIFNSAGELAGVLFGSGGGTTSGSHAGRVQQFLRTAWPPNPESAVPHQYAALAQNRAEDLTSPQRPGDRTMRQLPAVGTSTADRAPGLAPPMSPLPPATGALAGTGPMRESQNDSIPTNQELLANTELPQTNATSFTWQDVAGDSILQQCKTFLAILGLFALLAQASRVLRTD